MFFFKKSEVVVDAFVSEVHSHAHDYAPIDYAEKFIPDWWKKLPRADIDFNLMNRKNESIKLCGGFLDHTNRGLMIPLWSDLMIRTDPPGLYTYNFSDSISICESHPTAQRQGFREDLLNIKIISPWLLRSEKSVSFSFLPPFWNNNKPLGYQAAIGTTNFYYQNSTHINLLVEDNQQIFIPFNTPMLHLMPLTERKIILKRHLITDSEWHRENRRMISSSFIGSYYKLKKHREKLDEQQSKCPFSGFFK
jgi:hypothetical protein